MPNHLQTRYTTGVAWVELTPGATGLWWINEVWTEPEARGLGHARQLMKQAVEDADKDNFILGLCAMACDEEVDIMRLIEFYRSLGFYTVPGGGELCFGVTMYRKPRKEEVWSSSTMATSSAS